MKIVKPNDITGTKYDVHWGNGTSRRMLVESDGMGYSVHYTVILGELVVLYSIKTTLSLFIFYLVLAQ